jgi:multiple sugar transport system permease protein
MADVVARDVRIAPIGKRASGRSFVRRKSMIAFMIALPLILVIACLVIYPAFYAIHLATLNKSMTKFVGFGNFLFLFKRSTFWMVVEQSVLFAVTAVIFKAVIGFIVAHFVHNIPQKGQRKWRGMLLIPWVIPPAMSTRGPLARQSLLGAGRCHPRQCLGRFALLYDYVSGGIKIGARAAA